MNVSKNKSLVLQIVAVFFAAVLLFLSLNISSPETKEAHAGSATKIYTVWNTGGYLKCVFPDGSEVYGTSPLSACDLWNGKKDYYSLCIDPITPFHTGDTFSDTDHDAYYNSLKKKKGVLEGLGYVFYYGYYSLPAEQRCFTPTTKDTTGFAYADATMLLDYELVKGVRTFDPKTATLSDTKMCLLDYYTTPNKAGDHGGNYKAETVKAYNNIVNSINSHKSVPKGTYDSAKKAEDSATNLTYDISKNSYTTSLSYNSSLWTDFSMEKAINDKGLSVSKSGSTATIAISPSDVAAKKVAGAKITTATMTKSSTANKNFNNIYIYSYNGKSYNSSQTQAAGAYVDAVHAYSSFAVPTTLTDTVSKVYKDNDYNVITDKTVLSTLYANTKGILSTVIDQKTYYVVASNNVFTSFTTDKSKATKFTFNSNAASTDFGKVIVSNLVKGYNYTFTETDIPKDAVAGLNYITMTSSFTGSTKDTTTASHSIINIPTGSTNELSLIKTFVGYDQNSLSAKADIEKVIKDVTFSAYLYNKDTASKQYLALTSSDNVNYKCVVDEYNHFVADKSYQSSANTLHLGVREATVTSNGYEAYLTIKNIPDGYTVYVEETNIPTGWTYDEETNTLSNVIDGAVGSVFENGTGVQMLNNLEYYYKAKVTKTNEEGMTVAGAEYGLYTSENCEDATLYKTSVTGDDGVAEFDCYLRPGVNYYVKEISAPEGYELDTQVYKVYREIPAEKTFIQLETVTVNSTDTFKKLSIDLYKSETDLDTPIENAVFEVTTKQDIMFNGTKYKADTVVATLTTDAAGYASVDGLPVGPNYSYKYNVAEISVPAPYINACYNESFTADTVKSDLKLVLNVKNTWQKGVLTVNKFDDRGNTLAGAYFDIIAEEDVFRPGSETEYLYRAGDMIAHDLITDENGQIITSWQITEEEFASMEGTVIFKNKPEPIEDDDDETEDVVAEGDAEETEETEVEADVETTDEAETEAETEPVEEIVEVFEPYSYPTQKVVVTEDEDGVKTYTVYIVLYTGVKYQLVETQAPEGYLLDKTPHSFTMEFNADKDEYAILNNVEFASTWSEEVYNDTITGKIIITKTDIDDEGVLIPNCGIEILDENKEVIYRDFTDENGIVEFTLDYGKYYWHEFLAPEGYNINDDYYEFAITEDGMIIEETLKDSKITGNMQITKSDIDDKSVLLANCGVQLLDENKQIIEEKTTDENGIVVFSDIEYGTYYYHEYLAPPEYNIDDNYYKFTITEDGVTVDGNLYDSKIPKTGLVGSAVVPICAGVVLVLAGGAAIFVVKRQKKTK